MKNLSLVSRYLTYAAVGVGFALFGLLPESFAEALTAKEGDIVELQMTARFRDGSLLYTTDESVGNSTGIPKARTFKKPSYYGADAIIAGKTAPINGLAKSVLGMTKGQEKQLVLPPKDAFGVRDPKRVVVMQRVQRVPGVFQVPVGEFAQRFGGEPVVGKALTIVPYFKSRIQNVTDTFVTLENRFSGTKELQEKFGQVVVQEIPDGVQISLIPTLGAEFGTSKQMGRIVNVDETSFTVDYNHPDAGKEIVLDFQITSVVPFENVKTAVIPWETDHDSAFARARKDGKPVVILFYADWCKWCEKLQQETLIDPRVLMGSGEFVWVRINSDKEREYKRKYRQEDFPTVMVVAPDGRELDRIDGFKDAMYFSRALKFALKP